MDNLKARFSSVKFQIVQLLAALAVAGITVAVRYGKHSSIEDIRFSIVVGRYKERWLIRLYPEAGSLTFSGGVTKTFFDNNLWVFNNEYAQLQAIIGIVALRLAEIEGITLPESLAAGSFESVAVERVELTNHHVLPPDITQSEAIDRTDRLFMVLFPNSRDRDGDTLDKPGTTSLGKSKSTKSCRVYDPTVKFAKRPAHVSEAAWDKLTSACARHLRVEMILSKRDIEHWGLQTVAAWQDREKILGCLAKKYQRCGLSVAYQTSAVSLLPAEVRATNPTFEDYARYWITDRKRGSAPNKRSGSANRFRQYMENKGFNINVSLERHLHLAHGLDAILRPELRADLSDDLRRDQELFGLWWKAAKP